MSLTLKVLEEYGGDYADDIVRIDSTSMKNLELSEGELIIVRGKNTANLRCFLRNTLDKNIGNAANIIRINSFQRSKIGTKVGDMAIVGKSAS